MSRRPAKKQSLPNRTQRQNLSSDARFMVALLKKQPQTRDELCKSANLTLPTFYAIVRLLKSKNLIQQIDSAYALWYYKSLKRELIEIFDECTVEGCFMINTERLAVAVGKPYREIESTLYKLAGEYEFRFERGNDGEKFFCKGSRKPKVAHG